MSASEASRVRLSQAHSCGTGFLLIPRPRGPDFSERKTPRQEGPAGRLRGRGLFGLLLAEEAQNLLALLVGQLQRGGAGAGEDLGPRQGAGFLREVGVADLGLARGQVLELGLQ